MNKDIEKAKELLNSGDFTCVLCKGETVLDSKEKGVKPLLQWLSAGEELTGFCAADKIAGKAAALLYVKLGVSAVYAQVMSKSALAVFEKHGIHAEYDTLADTIVNRFNTGICPMEQAVFDISDPDEAITAIKNRIAELSQK